MKIEKEIIYNIVTSEGVRLEVSEAELVELYKDIGKIPAIQRAIVLSDTKLAPSTVTVRKDICLQGEY